MQPISENGIPPREGVPSTMATIEIWTGLPGSGRREHALDEALSVSPRPVWWLVDEMRRGERIEQRLCDRGDGVSAGVDVLSTGHLAAHLLQMSGQHVPTVDIEVRRLLLRDLLASTSISATVDAPLGLGWARRVEEFYERFVEERFLGPRDGHPPIRQLLQARYSWALQVIETYESRIGDAGLTDESLLPRIACEWVEGDLFSPPDLLVVDRLGPQRPLLLELLHRLSERCGRVIVLVDELEEAGDGLALARQDVHSWRSRHTTSTIPHTPPTQISALAHNLFAPPGNPVMEGVTASATLSHHMDRASEVRSVAAEVSRLIHDQGVPEDEIAVVCTALTSYAPYVEELFERYGVRPDMRLGHMLNVSPVARLTSALFGLRAEGISREGLTDLLLNPYVSYGQAFADKGGVLSFDTAARRARINGRHERLETAWIEPMEAELVRLQEAARLVEKDEQGGSEDAREEQGRISIMRRERLENQIRFLERALRDFRNLAKLILSLPDPCTVEEVVEWLRRMQDALQIRASVHRMARHDPERGQRDVLALGHLELTLEHVAATLRLQGRRRWEVSRYAELMRLAIGTGRLRVGKRLQGGVPVIGPLDLRGLKVRHLFFLGLTADAWPRDPEIDLADPVSARWSDIDRLAESRALTLETFFAGENVHLSTPCPKRGQGKAAPSPLLSELESAGIRLTSNDNREMQKADWRSALDLMPDVGLDFTAANHSAALRRLATARLQQPKGTVQWERVVKTAAVETQRQDPATLTLYEGLIGADGIGSMIAQRVLDRPWSASRLDRYATCPMQFLFKDVLKLEGVEEVEEEVDLSFRGILVHEILARATLRLRERRGGPVVLTQHPEEEAQILEETAREVLEAFPFDNLLWRRLVDSICSGLRDESEPPGYLKRVLDIHADKRLKGEAIYHVEAGFGLQRDTEAAQDQLFTEPIQIRADGVTIQLAGRIDRISLHPESGWRIWDYKVTGKNPSGSALIAGGRSFQLPLYFWALEELRDTGRLEIHPFDRSSYFITNHSGKPTLPIIWFWKDQERESEQLKGRVVAIDRALRAGRFHHPLSQNDKLCEDSEYNYCAFRDICRRDHRLFAQRESHLRLDALRDAYILGFQEQLQERLEGEGSEG